MIFRPRRINSKLVKGPPKLKTNVELISAGPAALNEIRSASPGTSNPREMAKSYQTHMDNISRRILKLECA